METYKSIESILSIMLTIFIGYLLTKRGWFNQQTGNLFSKLIINVTLPVMMLANMLGSFDRNKLFSIGYGILSPITTIIITYTVAQIFATVIKLPKEQRGIFSCMFSMSNTILIGIPVNMAIFGDESLPIISNAILVINISKNGFIDAELSAISNLVGT